MQQYNRWSYVKMVDEDNEYLYKDSVVTYIW